MPCWCSCTARPLRGGRVGEISRQKNKYDYKYAFVTSLGICIVYYLPLSVSRQRLGSRSHLYMYLIYILSRGGIAKRRFSASTLRGMPPPTSHFRVWASRDLLAHAQRELQVVCEHHGVELQPLPHARRSIRSSTGSKMSHTNRLSVDRRISPQAQQAKHHTTHLLNGESNKGVGRNHPWNRTAPALRRTSRIS